MKDFLSNENYCYKIHTLLMKSSAYSLSFYRQPPYMEYHALHLYKEIFIPPSMIFQKSHPPYK